jgi:uncharacterized protein with NRDE domain
VCLILAAWQVHPEFPLVIAANRDEFFERPTQPAERWPDLPAGSPEVIAGRDLSAGGTWLGISRSGRFAALTNYRDSQVQRPDAPTRGSLVSGFLQGTQSPQSYLADVAAIGAQFNGFNLLVSDGRSMICYNNVERRNLILQPGIHGLSNHAMNTPWPKVKSAKALLGEALPQLPDDDMLFRFLRDESIAADDDLPQTGVGIEWERRLSAIFVRGPRYGTRSSTVVIGDRHGRMIFDEQEWNEGGTAGGRRRFSLRIDRH